MLRAAAILLLLASQPQAAAAMDNGLGRLPPLARQLTLATLPPPPVHHRQSPA